jgi:hypothetical protein
MAKDEVRSAEPATWDGLSPCPCAAGDTIAGAAADGGEIDGETVGPLGRLLGVTVGETAGGIALCVAGGAAVA